MIYRGRVENGCIVLEDQVTLAEGTPVTVRPVELPAASHEGEVPTLYERFQNVIGKASDLPADLAEQHDHYLYGTSRS